MQTEKLVLQPEGVNSCSYLTVHRYFEQMAASKKSQAIAIKFKQQHFSFAQLNVRANYLAWVLRDKGVSEGDVVALYMSRSVEMIVAMLAIFKAGAAYLPLEKTNPPARNIMYMDAAKVNIVITSHADDEVLQGERIILHVNNSQWFEGTANTPPISNCTPDSLAYIMFTSGSSGQPKGVMVPHRGISRLVIDSNFVTIEPGDSILQFSPISFDASTFEIWAPLLNGATLVLYQGEVFDPNVFRQDIMENNVTILWLTAALFHLIAERFIEALKPLRVLLAGGDVLNPSYCRKILDEIPGITLINGYGPTENTTFTCCHRMTIHNPPFAQVPIGLPITGTQIIVVDETFNAVADGDVGELIAAGAGVALGYLNEPNNHGFIQAADGTGGLWYRTGDMVRVDDKGQIEFCGRKDNLVKVRGYRVSLEEVRLGLMLLEGVQDAIVRLDNLPDSGQLLVSQLLVTERFTLTSLDVSLAMREKFPAFMVPDKIEITDSLPINNNGKLESNKPMFSS